MPNDSRLFSLAMAVSLICHLLFFAVLLYAQDRKTEKPFAPAIITVSMVTLPPQGKAAQGAKGPSPSKAPAPEAKTPQTPKTEAVAPPASAPPEVSVAPAKKSEKTSLKKKTFKTEKVVQSAIKEIEQKVETTKPDPLAEALDRLRNKVEKDEAGQDRNTVGRLDPGGRTSTNGGTSGMSGKQVADLIDIYRIEIAYQVQKNWAFSEQLAGKEKKLQASLVFKVMPDGQIGDLFFTDRSGNSYLDDSAYNAIIKSNPVAPHPEGISKPFIHVGLRFTPEGVE